MKKGLKDSKIPIFWNVCTICCFLSNFDAVIFFELIVTFFFIYFVFDVCNYPSQLYWKWFVWSKSDLRQIVPGLNYCWKFLFPILMVIWNQILSCGAPILTEQQNSDTSHFWSYVFISFLTMSRTYVFFMRRMSDWMNELSEHNIRCYVSLIRYQFIL